MACDSVKKFRNYSYPYISLVKPVITFNQVYLWASERADDRPTRTPRLLPPPRGHGMSWMGVATACVAASTGYAARPAVMRPGGAHILLDYDNFKVDAQAAGEWLLDAISAEARHSGAPARHIS